MGKTILILSKNSVFHPINNVLNQHYDLIHYYDLTSFYSNIQNKLPDIILLDFNFEYVLSAIDIYIHLRKTPIYNQILIIFIISNNKYSKEPFLDILQTKFRNSSLEHIYPNTTIHFLKKKLKGHNYNPARNDISNTKLSSFEKTILIDLNALILNEKIYHLNIFEICQALNVSVLKFRNLIKKYFDQSISEYLYDLKMIYAEYYISENLYSLNDIYPKLGFSSFQKFSNAFKKKYLLIPKDYLEKRLVVKQDSLYKKQQMVVNELESHHDEHTSIKLGSIYYLYEEDLILKDLSEN
jgi:AraC-like DNA-binding protein